MKCLAFSLALGVSLCASRAESQTLTTLVSFTGNGGTANGGGGASGSLALSGTTLYGMSAFGGASQGNIFSVGLNGTNFQNLVSFTGNSGTANGLHPRGNLTRSDTTLYGMTELGGTNGNGNIFRVGTDGTNYQNLLSFTGGTLSGVYPEASLTLGGTTLYGMTQQGGANGFGTVFSVETGGMGYRNLVSFTGTGGWQAAKIHMVA